MGDILVYRFSEMINIMKHRCSSGNHHDVSLFFDDNNARPKR